MNRIIVTIRINQKKEYDLELPVHQKIKDLMQDISDFRQAFLGLCNSGQFGSRYEVGI